MKVEHLVSLMILVFYCGKSFSQPHESRKMQYSGLKNIDDKYFIEVNKNAELHIKNLNTLFSIENAMWEISFYNSARKYSEHGPSHLYSLKCDLNKLEIVYMDIRTKKTRKMEFDKSRKEFSEFNEKISVINEGTYLQEMIPKGASWYSILHILKDGNTHNYLYSSSNFIFKDSNNNYPPLVLRNLYNHIRDIITWELLD